MNIGILYLLKIIIFRIILHCVSLNSNYSVLWYYHCYNNSFTQLLKFNISSIYILFFLYLIFVINILIEVTRTLLDLIDGESELASGCSTEHFRGCFLY